MKKTFLNLFFLTFCTISFSQSGTSSPYSFYGVGTNTFKGSIDNRSMGGLSVYSDSIHLNLTNPASFSELKRVNYSLGITYDDLTFKSENANENSKSSNVNYLAVGIPTKYFTFGFGIPFQGFSNLNLGFEIGKRGTTNSGLIEENFFSIRLGMSLSDLWFVKNKYN